MKKQTCSSISGTIALALLLSGFASCGPNYYFEENKPLSNGQWAYADTLDFRFTVTDTLETYNMYLNFEYADTFSSQNIYLKLYTRFPDGKRLAKQKSFDLFDEKGLPLGKCSNGTCRLFAVLQERAFFNQPGEYLITLEQFGRSNPLHGVISIGLALESTGKHR